MLNTLCLGYQFVAVAAGAVIAAACVWTAWRDRRRLRPKALTELELGAFGLAWYNELFRLGEQLCFCAVSFTIPFRLASRDWWVHLLFALGVNLITIHSLKLLQARKQRLAHLVP